MGDLQHYCLRWNNYQSSITSAFENLRDDEDFVDVTLACDGKSLKAHRVVLSACSPYFRELLKSTPCKHPVIVLQDVVFDDLHALVEFIYHGEVNVHQKNLSTFLKTAEVLRVSGLTQQSDSYSETSFHPTDKSFHCAPVTEERASPLLSRHRRSSSNVSQQRIHRGSPESRDTPDSLENSPLPLKRSKLMSSDNNLNNINNNNNNIHSNISNSKEAKNDEEMVQNLSRTSGTRESDEDIDEKESDKERERDKESRDEDEPPVDFSISLKSNLMVTKRRCDFYDRSKNSPSRDDIKSEPMDLVPAKPTNACNSDSNDSVDISAVSESAGSGIQHLSVCDHEDSFQGAQNYLDSKLFAATSSFNFSMAAALAADSLAGMNSQNHPGNVDSLAGTSSQGLIMPPPMSGGINEPQDCPYCRRTFSCYYSLKRHFQDKHERSDTLYVCEFCHRRYRTKNSLTTHKSLQHRGTSGMLKRLLKTSSLSQSGIPDLQATSVLFENMPYSNQQQKNC
nr:PREDICTED: broad-complex core protein isoforms 1/2/3/4/5 isoform X3 [Bemisia tabaci]XP_018907243.1 PREDICTED: broad-complex core protein isoforms 1/2/3/4/5 isoform X3 [Bemisia tabaci]XP_018907244.1 PREDICTED: broad-complex core protein isoforms 1/2/3/4/5 isoform X3 [Bemisia tabaci]